MNYGGDRFSEAAAGVHPLASQHLDQDQAEGPNVGPLVHYLSSGLLGTHIGRRAHHDSLARGFQRQRRGLGQFCFRQLRLQRLGQAEVQHLDLPLEGDLHVRRLQVAVNDALLVGYLQSLGHLQGKAMGLLHREGSLRNPLRQGGTLHQFQNQRSHIARFLEAVNGADVRVIERSQEFRFSLKPAHSLRIFDKLLGQDLQRDLPTQATVSGLVDRTHTAFPEFGRDLVVIDGLA